MSADKSRLNPTVVVLKQRSTSTKHIASDTSQSNRSGFETVLLFGWVPTDLGLNPTVVVLKLGVELYLLRVGDGLNPTVVVLKPWETSGEGVGRISLNPTVVVLKPREQIHFVINRAVSIQP